MLEEQNKTNQANKAKVNREENLAVSAKKKNYLE